MAQKQMPPVARPSSRALRLQEGEVVHVGVDVHKHTYHIAVLSDVRGLVTTWVQPASPELLVQRLLPIQKQVVQVVSEAGPTGFALVRRLRDAGLNAEVIAPSKIPTLPGQQAKSDRLDGRKRATFAQKGLLRPVRVPTAQEEADRQVVRMREQLVRKSRSIQQQIKAFLLQHGLAEPAGLAHWSVRAIQELRGLALNQELRFCLDLMLDERQHAQEQLEHATRRVSELAKAERHRAAATVLQTVPGVGPITAMTFRTELHEPGRFVDAGQVAQMVGLAPQVVQSGLSRREGGLLRSGNARLRTVLVEAAWRWVPGTRSRPGGTASWPRRPAAPRRRSWGWPDAWPSCCGDSASAVSLIGPPPNVWTMSTCFPSDTSSVENQAGASEDLRVEDTAWSRPAGLDPRKKDGGPHSRSQNLSGASSTNSRLILVSSGF